MDEGARNDDLTAVATGQSSSYTVFGERVAGILEAAEEAAEKIRESARHEAAELERLHEIAALVQDALPSRDESLAKDLERRATPSS